MALTLEESKELKRLMYEHYSLSRFFQRDPWTEAVAITAFAVWLGFAIWNGALGMGHLVWGVPIIFLLVFLGSRKIRYNRYYFYYFDLINVFTGVPFGPIRDPDDIRRQLAACEARIAELEQKKQVTP